MDTRGKLCEDRALLLSYAAGATDEADRRAVERHLQDCAGCRGLVADNQELIQQYLALPTLAGPHPAPEILSRWTQEGGKSEELLPAEQHVSQCGECQQIVTVLRKVQADIDSPSLGERLRDAARGLGEGWTAMTRGLPSYLRGPLPAYLLVLLLLYPAYLGFTGLVGNVDTPGGPVVSESAALLAPPYPIESEAQRGPGGNRLSLDPVAGRHVLTFFVPVAPGRFRYRVELINAQGDQLMVTEDARSFDGVGTFALIVPGGFLDPGDYLLRMEEVDRDSGEVSQRFSFPFSVNGPQ